MYLYIIWTKLHKHPPKLLRAWLDHVMDIWYKWIYWQENICLFSLLIDGPHTLLTSVSLFSWKGRVRIVILVSCEYYFIRVHENMVQHPSYNISITSFNMTSRELTFRGFTVEFKAWQERECAVTEILKEPSYNWYVVVRT